MSLLRFDNSGSNLEVFPNIPTPGGGVDFFEINNGFGLPMVLGNINGYAKPSSTPRAKVFKSKNLRRSICLFKERCAFEGRFLVFRLPTISVSVENNPFWSADKSIACRPAENKRNLANWKVYEIFAQIGEVETVFILNSAGLAGNC